MEDLTDNFDFTSSDIGCLVPFGGAQYDLQDHSLYQDVRQSCSFSYESPDGSHGDSSACELPDLDSKVVKEFLDNLSNSRGNSKRCKRYRDTKKLNIQQQKEDLNTLKERNDLLKRTEFNMIKKYKRATEIYLGWIRSRKLIFDLQSKT